MENITTIRVKGTDYSVGPLVDSQLSTSSTNPVQNKIIKSELDRKQDKLVQGENITIDPETNIISAIVTGSGGIPDAPSDGKQYVRKNKNWEEISIPEIDSKADKVTIESVSGSSIELKPNKFLKLSGVSSSITLTLDEEIPGIMNEYMFQFNSGSTPTTINLPGSVRWIGDHTIESNKTYIISIVSNLAVIGGA